MDSHGGSAAHVNPQEPRGAMAVLPIRGGVLMYKKQPLLQFGPEVFDAAGVQPYSTANTRRIAAATGSHVSISVAWRSRRFCATTGGWWACEHATRRVAGSEKSSPDGRLATMAFTLGDPACAARVADERCAVSVGIVRLWLRLAGESSGEHGAPSLPSLQQGPLTNRGVGDAGRTHARTQRRRTHPHLAGSLST